MARPTATAATITPYLRGTSLSLKWYMGKHKYTTPVLATGVAEDQLAKNKYVKPTHANYLTINETLSLHTDLLQQATGIVQSSGEVSVNELKSIYLRLVTESAVAQAAEEKKAQQDAAVDRAKRKLNRLIGLPELDDEIESLQAQLAAKLTAKTNMQKELGLYQDDRLIHFIAQYAARKGELATPTTKRAFGSLATTVTFFRADSRIQDVNEQWIADFVSWCISTPTRFPVYSYKADAKGKLCKDQIIRYREGKTRQNSTVWEYLIKLKSVLKYFKNRPKMLPAGVEIDESYKLYQFELPTNEENVIALEEFEVQDLFKFRRYKKDNHEKAIDLLLFLCSTSLRYSDITKVVPSSIKNGQIHLLAKKTKKHSIYVDIPLNPISTSILQKYNFDMNGALMQDYQLNERICEVLNYENGRTFPSFQIKETIVKQRRKSSSFHLPPQPHRVKCRLAMESRSIRRA